MTFTSELSSPSVQWCRKAKLAFADHLQQFFLHKSSSEITIQKRTRVASHWIGCVVSCLYCACLRMLKATQYWFCKKKNIEEWPLSTFDSSGFEGYRHPTSYMYLACLLKHRVLDI